MRLKRQILLMNLNDKVIMLILLKVERERRKNSRLIFANRSDFQVDFELLNWQYD